MKLFMSMEVEDEFTLENPVNFTDPVRAACLGRMAASQFNLDQLLDIDADQELTSPVGPGRDDGAQKGQQQPPTFRRRRLSLVEALNNGSIEIPQSSNYFFVDDQQPPLWDEMFPSAIAAKSHPSSHHQQSRIPRPPLGRQSPAARLRPGKFPLLLQEDISTSTTSTASSSAAADQLARQKRRSRSQPGPRFRESALSSGSSAVQELSDFIEEDCEMAQCQSEGNAVLWGSTSSANNRGNNNESASKQSGTTGTECVRGKGSCCSQDSGVRSSTHSAGSSLTGSSDTDADGHARAPCCSTAAIPSSSSSAGGVLFTAEAVFENVAMLRDELPFSPGDEVTVLDCPSADLWYGVCGPRSGWFPASYIRPKNRELCRLCAPDGQAAAKFDAAGEDFPSPEMRLLRRRIVQELMSTEREYVRLLEHLVQGFLEQCRRRKELFPEERVQRIFGNLDQILKLHVRLLRELQAALDSKEPERSALANVFLRLSQHFAIYTDYCNNRTLSCAELAQLEQLPQYFHFFEACRLLRGMSKLSLDAFLLTPVQRICRYPLQLLELLKATPAGHSDRLALELAQRTMKQVAAQVNDGKRRVDAIQKIWLWQKSVQAFRGPDLVENNHRLLINGELYCRALWRAQPQWAKAVQVYLFDQTIVLCRRDVLRRSQLVFKERMSLMGTSAQDLHDGKDITTGDRLKNAFKLAGPAREYIFCCPDPATKGLWLEALRDRPRPQPPSPAERRLAMLM